MYIMNRLADGGSSATAPAKPAGNFGKVFLVVAGIAVIAALLKPVVWGK